MTRFVRWFVSLGVAAIVATLIVDAVYPIDMRVAANVSLVGMALGTTVFVLGYGTRSNWRNSRIGPTYLAYKASMALVLWQIVIAVWVSDTWPGRHEVRYVFYSLGAIGTVVWAAVLREAQKRRINDAADAADQDEESLLFDDYRRSDDDRCSEGSSDGGGD